MYCIMSCPICLADVRYCERAASLSSNVIRGIAGLGVRSGAVTDTRGTYAQVVSDIALQQSVLEFLRSALLQVQRRTFYVSVHMVHQILHRRVSCAHAGCNGRRRLEHA